MNKKILLVLCIGLLWLMSSDAGAANFNHASKAHARLNCSACHNVTVARPNVTRFPGHNACASCHDFSQLAGSNFKGFCGVCHTGVPQSATRVALFSFPRRNSPDEFGISFSHTAHLKAPIRTADLERTMNCADCHKMVEPVGGTQPAREMVIGDAHANCFRCHGPKPEKPPAMTQCAGCHAIGGPKGPDLVGVVPEFVHEDHMYDIRPKTKAQYAQKSNLCVECHSSVVASNSLKEISAPESEYCLQCHSGRFGLPEPLPQDVLRVLAFLRMPARTAVYTWSRAQRPPVLKTKF